MVTSASQGNRSENGGAGEPSAAQTSAVVWHDLECGSYTADLPLWRELAASAGTGTGPQAVLDVGAGTGRVTLDLARRGHHVTALDLDAELLDALRARAEHMHVETVHADARAFALAGRDFDLCVVPMQTIQLMGGAAGRVALLRRAQAHLRPGALLACAIVTELDPFDSAAGDLAPSPEIGQLDGVHYVSRATRVRVSARSIRIERERSIHRSESATASPPPAKQRDVVELDRVNHRELERDGREAGLTPAGVRRIPATHEHVASEAVLLRA